MKVLVLANRYARTFNQKSVEPPAIAAAFAAAGLAADLRLLAGCDIADAAREASGYDVVVAGGGDGTVGTVAAGVAEGGRVLGVLPLGTRNHFARDLGIPGSLEEAVAVIARGETRAVDLGEVNGAVFVNNASLGLYPRLVEERDDKRFRLGLGKTLAMLVATVQVLRRFRVLRVRVEVPGHSRVLTTPFVVVGNNEYSMEAFRLGARSCLDGGALSLYVARCTRARSILRLAALALLDRLEQARDFETARVAEARLDTWQRTARVALDGEVRRLRTPLHFRSRPAALRVLAPPACAASGGAT